MDETELGVRFDVFLPSEHTAVAASRFGGNPDLPHGAAWPEHEGTPMAFLGQIRLDDLRLGPPGSVLPKSGLVSIFAALEHDGMYPPDEAAVHVEVFVGEPLAPRPWPDELVPELRFDPAAAEPRPALTFPGWDADVDDIEEVIAELDAVPYEPRPIHQSLGHHKTLQGVPRPARSVLLLQLDSDTFMGVMYGDGGLLHIWMPDEPHGAGPVAGCRIVEESG